MDDSCPNPENVDSEETMDVNNNDHIIEEDVHDGDPVGYSPLDTEDTTTTLEYSYQPISSTLGPNTDDDDDNQESIHNYQALADQALRSLDMEYVAVINAGRTHPTTDESSLPVSTTTTTTPTEEDSTRIEDMNGSSEIVIIDSHHNQEEEEEALASESNSIMVLEESTDEQEKGEEVVVEEEEEERVLPSIDSDAVLRAVRAIRLQSPQLTQSLDNNSSTILLPSSHPIIPIKPLSAFQRNSPKAILATANLTRSATLAEAYSRLLFTQNHQNDLQKQQSSSLLIHILGADHVECNSINSTFAPFVRWIGASSFCSTIEHVRIELLGPNVPLSSQNINDPTNIMPRYTATATTSVTTTNLKSASVVCQNCCYHDYLKEKRQTCHNESDSYYPDLIIIYNAGIWGYEEWKPTLEAMCLVFEKKEVPTIITAYTVEEAEDDAEVIEEVIKSSFSSLDKNSTEQAMLKQKCLWPAQTNPFRSKKKRDTASAPKNRIYYENGAWQAWLFGKQQQDS